MPVLTLMAYGKQKIVHSIPKDNFNINGPMSIVLIRQQGETNARRMLAQRRLKGFP